MFRKIAVTAALGVVLATGAACSGGSSVAKGVCDQKGCSTREAAVEAARAHVAARAGHPATGICLVRGGDTWWSWSLTAAGCEFPAVWAPLSAS